MKKSRVFALFVSAILLLGMSFTFVDAETVTTFPDTIEDSIGHGEWIMYQVELQFDYEVHFRMTIVNPLPGTDLDIEVWFGDELVFWIATGYGFLGDPEIIEDGYFLIPYTGTYEIWINGYYVPSQYEDGVDFSLYIDSSEELYQMPPSETHGLSTGALTSYVNNHYNAYHASEKAPFMEVNSAFVSTHINHLGAMNAYAWTEYTLTPYTFCSEDAHIVGGVVWMRAAWLYDNFQSAREFLCSRDFVNYIDGVPLSELTNVKTGSVQKLLENGELVRYRKVTEYGVFKPGELVGLIGEGMHRIDVHLIGPGFDIPWLWYYFWLMPEGWTGPH